MNILKSKWGVAAIAGVLVIGGGFAAVNAATAQTEPVAVVVTDQPTVAPIVVPTADPVTVNPAPVVVAPEPAPVVEPEPAPAEPAPFVEPEGTKAEWVPSEDANNREGGDWNTEACASGRFQTGSDGTPVCQG